MGLARARDLCKYTSFGSHVVSASQGIEISNTLACSLASCGMPPSVPNATVAEIVVTYTCNDRTTDGGDFDCVRCDLLIFIAVSLHVPFSMGLLCGCARDGHLASF